MAEIGELLAKYVAVLADGTLKYKFPEKTAAREQAMKHFGLYERDNTQKPSVGINVVHVEGFRSVEFDPLPLTRKG